MIDHEVSDQAGIAGLVHRFAVLDQERRDAESVLDGINAERAEVEKALLEAIEAGPLGGKFYDKATGLTVYLKHSVYASVPKETEAEAIHALKAHNLGDLVRTTVSAQTLRSWVLERIRAKEDIPEDIAATINISHRYNMATRRGSK